MSVATSTAARMVSVMVMRSVTVMGLGGFVVYFLFLSRVIGCSPRSSRRAASCRKRVMSFPVSRFRTGFSAGMDVRQVVSQA